MKASVFASMVGAATLVVASQLTSVQAFAASANGTARQVVIAALAIANVSDLDFGSAAAGEAAKTVAPGTSENAENGSFNVTGQANTAYTITLPAIPVQIVTGGAGPNEVIEVADFTSFPAAGANGLLNGTGAQALYVGATRAALSATQAAGTYTGAYTVTVVY
jgi:spore coat protein U-like protein